MFIVEPGEYKFAVSYHSKLLAENTFVFEGDRAYYIRYGTKVVARMPFIFDVYRKIAYFIDSVPKDEALELLKECRLIEVPERP